MTQQQTIVLKVSIDCDACKRKVKKALDVIDGVDAINVDMQRDKVTVTGTVEPKALVKKLAKIGKKAELSSNQQGVSREEGADGTKKGVGKKGNISKVKVAATDSTGEIQTETYTHMFSDENANNCSIM